jgi:diaminopimelate epimerase
MKFTKMHGIGNDYLYVNGFAETVADPAQLSREMSDRHRGVGADGLILVLPSRKADVCMRMFNADGSEAQMCGNGIRCLAKFAYERNIVRKNPLTVETGRGVLSLGLNIDRDKVNKVTVNMGQPILPLAEIPVDRQAVAILHEPMQYTFSVGKPSARRTIEDAVFVSMGNPHAVMFVEKLDEIDVPVLGPLVENYGGFPERINAHWVQTQSRGEVTMRSWERGSGMTQACGTGACAVCVAGVLTDRTERKILAHLPGGDLSLEWRAADDCVYMTGPAAEIFTGDWPGGSDGKKSK